MIQIYDNFLDELDFATIQSKILGVHFPWFYQSETGYEELPNDLNDFQFTHIFYTDNEPKSHMFPLIQPIVSKLNAMAFVRIKANLTTVNPVVRRGIFHRDYLNENITTSLFYLQNTNGGSSVSTSIKKEKDVNINMLSQRQIDDLLQWSGAVAIIAGHVLNAVGPSVYPWNILAFAVGTVLFLAWAIRVTNKPQMLVNVVALVIGLVGLFKAFV